MRVPTDLGARRIVPITGGPIAGPRLAGEILDNGAYLLRLDDGSLVYLQTRSFRNGLPDVMSRAGNDPGAWMGRSVHMEVPFGRLGFNDHARPLPRPRQPADHHVPVARDDQFQGVGAARRVSLTSGGGPSPHLTGDR